MNIQILKQQIQTNQLNNFYVFTGEEWMVQKLYIQQIAKVKKLDIKHIDVISDIYRSLGSKSLFAKPYLYVIRDDKDILINEKLQQQLMSGLAGSNIIILILSTLDKRLKAFKAFEGIIINFEKMSLETLKKYVKREISLSEANCIKLIEICEYDYGRILLEIDKIKQLGMPADEAFTKLLSEGIIYQPPEDSIFDLVDAILKRNIKATYRFLQNCYNIGESNLAILSVLYDNTKQLLQVQSYDGSDIVKATGLTNWQINIAKSRLGKYRIGELVYLLKRIREVEKGIKLGDIEDTISIEYVLAGIL